MSSRPGAAVAAAAVICALLLACSTDAGAPLLAGRIAAVEQTLHQAVVIDGQPAPARSLSEAMRELHVPGVSIAVVHGGRIEWARSYGTTTRGGSAVTPDTLFQAGSISKSVAAIGAWRLVASAAVGVDDDVAAHLRGWQLPPFDGPPVTLRRLLSHTAGINVHGLDGYAALDRLPTLLQILNGAVPANTPPIRVVARPGERWMYSGGGYTVVQKLVEDVTHEPYERWMQTRVLAPLGMAHSRYELQWTPGATFGAAAGHRADGTPVSGGHHVYPELAAAGLWSTASDLARSLVAVQQAVAGSPGAIVPAAVARQMLAPVRPGHSAGFDVGGAAAARWFAKGGDTLGYAAFMVGYESGDGAVVMTNGDQGAILARQIVQAIATTYAWPDFGPRHRTAVAVPAAAAARVEGTYVFRGKNRFSVRSERGRLLVESPGEAAETLHAASADEWFTLMQDVSYVFDRSDGPAAGGHIQVGDTTIRFDRVAP